MTATIPTFQHVSIVEIGSFTGGSFGRSGNPSKVYPYYRVQCRSCHEARGTVQGVTPFTFRKLYEAIKFAYKQDEIEAANQAKREAEREAESVLRTKRFNTQRRIEKALKSLGLDGAIRWSDVLIQPEQMTPESREAVAALSSPPESLYDVRVAGVLYRLRMGFPTPSVAKIELA